MRRLSFIFAPAMVGLLIHANVVVAAAEPENVAVGLPPGWSREYEIPELTNPKTGNVIQQKSMLRLWEQLGWLNAKYESPELGLQWQVVLARASDPKVPEVKIEGSPFPGFEVKYGPYWLRDQRGSLRMMREIKTPESPPWPAMPIDKEAKQRGLTTLNFPNKSVHAIADWNVGDWLWMGCGLRDNATGQERYDILVRLQHRNLPMYGARTDSYAMFTGAPYTVDFTHAQQRGHYEADLFLTTRSLASVDDVARLIADAKAKKDNDTSTVVGKPAPKIAAENWVNVPEGTDGAELLKDKPALVVFWSARDAEVGQCLWDCEQLYRKFKDRGFVMVGIYPPRDRKDAPEIAKEHDVSFPLASDANAPQAVRSMGNAMNFKARSSPALFLIDKNGKVTWGNSKALPTAEQIEALLKEPESKPVP